MLQELNVARRASIGQTDPGFGAIPGFGLVRRHAAAAGITQNDPETIRCSVD
jgi:hypothetical protein